MSESNEKRVASIYRSHTNGQLTEKDTDQKVALSGWVHSRRDHGGLIFIDLRDRWGVTQLTFDPKHQETFTTAEKLRSEYVISVKGEVRSRPADMVNKALTTGKIEVEVNHITVLNEAATPPFAVDSDEVTNEELRLEYRYLDLRRERMQHNILLRHNMLQAIRRYFYQRDFVEIETPILIKGTPEGAREYAVPSRLYPGKFYVLPQSPQQLKQLSMVAGYDRYMQIARCFRDEDQRGDRQPEFTQVDIEMSFVTATEVMKITEECLKELTTTFRPDAEMKKGAFKRLTWDEALNRYGSDKPDTRFDLELSDVSEICQDCGFSIFSEAVQSGGVVKALRVPGGATTTRKEIDELTEVAKTHGAKGLAWVKLTESGAEGVPVEKLGEEKVQEIISATSAQTGDLVLFTADTRTLACESLGAVRLAYASRHDLANDKEFAFCWVTDFPMFEEDTDTGTLGAKHHPFTRPKQEDIQYLETDPLKVKAEAYDITLNGYEIAGGSIRIHETDLQSKVFSALQISQKEANRRFGHMLKAFTYGAPPHGGIAWGFDRLAMLFAGEPNIREVIAFPKDQKARDTMLGAPDEITKQQLKELHLTLDQED